MNFKVTPQAIEQLKELQIPKNKGIRIKADLVPG